MGGARTLYYYDTADRKVAEINAAGTYAAFVYDAHGNLTSSRVYGTATSLPGTAGGSPPTPPSGEYRETLYYYDRANRVSSTAISGLLVGVHNGTSYQYNVQTVSTLYYLDAFGNLVREVDGNGNNVYHYYDRNGREIAKVDQENYLTSWTRDAEGNVTSETRYANKIATTVDQTTTVATLITAAGTSADNRVTTFAYDKNGRRIQEVRQNVLAATVASSGSLSTPTLTSATIIYAYNGLGQVTRKTEANGDIVDFNYDNQGRLSTRLEAGYVDQSSANVRLRTDYYYDGLGNIVYERPSDDISNGSAIASRYHYGAGGLLQWSETPDGARTQYFYDVKGRLVGTLINHNRANGTAVGTRHQYSYDIVGRVIEERLYDYDATRGWDWGVPTASAYNSYGDLISTSINGTVQEQYEYDKAGRVVRTNSGDGVWKFFIYDGNSNATAAITSAGYDFGSITVATALTLVGQSDVNGTYSVFDKRGLAVQSIEEGRELSGSVTQTLTTSATYNAFGETLSQTDVLGYRTDYLYNAMGRLIESKGPQVSVTLENGTVQNVRPTDNYYYDVSGRLIASRDANGTLTSRLLLAGTGHEGSDALVTKEFYADGNNVTIEYDVHRNARRITDQIGRVTTQSFDNMGRTIQVSFASGLINYYAYDGVGQRIRSWNNVLGSGEAEATDYDAMGRVTAVRTVGGDTTTTSYSWNASLNTAGLAAFGGWEQTVSTDADRASTSDSIYAAVQRTDAFGHVISRTDKGGQAYSYQYDKAGRVTTETSTLYSSLLRNSSYSYYNSGKIKQVISGDVPVANTDWTRKIASYEYDALGQLKREYLAIETGDYTPEQWIPPENPGGPPFEVEPQIPGDGEGGTTIPESYYVSTIQLQDGRADYDALGRVTRYRDVAQYGGADNVDKNWTYDAVGNVRSISTTYRPMQANGVLSNSTLNQTYWYRYDTLNRVVTTKGMFVGSAGSGYIVRGSAGSDLSYNGVSQRMTAQTGSNAQEAFTYNAADLVTNVTIGGVTRATTSYDTLGRINGYAEYNGSGQLSYNRYSIVYDVRGLVLSEKGQTKQGGDWIYTHTVNSYSATGTGSASPAIYWSGQTGTSTGSLLYYSETKNWKNGSSSPVYGTPGNYSSADLDYADSYTTNSYLWRDGAVQNTVQLVNRDGNSTSSYTYDRDGALRSVSISGGTRPRSVYYSTNLQGQILGRGEYDNVFNQGDPFSQAYMFGGRQMGVVSNDGTGNVDYATSIANRTVTPGTGAFQNGSTSASIYADFDANFDQINGNSEQGASSGYVVANGDTLSSIAAAVWGDASLWYKLADANGLSGSEPLVAGRSLLIPGSINNIHHNADTFRPYDPAESIGNTSPNTPKPPKAKNKCGIFGQILLVAIAVAVTALTYGALTGPTTTFLGAVGAGAVSGAAGSIVSQGFGVATGIQEKFSWKAVGMAAISGAVGGGLGKLGSLAKAGSALDKGLAKVGNFLSNGGVIGDVTRGALSSALSQGIGVATGLQKGFSWTGVAAAGIMAGAMGVVSRSISGQATGNPWNADGSANDAYRGATIANSLISSAAGSLANAATRSVVQGTDFGDNLMAALPDIIGGTLGTLASSALKSAFSTERAPTPDDDAAETAAPTTQSFTPAELRARAETSLFNSANSRFSSVRYSGSEPSSDIYLASDAPEPSSDPEIVVTANRVNKPDNWLEELTGVDVDWEGRNLSLSVHIGKTDLRANADFNHGVGIDLNVSSGKYSLGVNGGVRYRSGTLTVNGGVAAVGGSNKVALGGTLSVNKSSISAGIAAEAKLGSARANLSAGSTITSSAVSANANATGSIGNATVAVSANGTITSDSITLSANGNASVSGAAVAVTFNGSMTAESVKVSAGASVQSSLASGSVGLAADMNDKNFFISGAAGQFEVLGRPVGSPGFYTATIDGNKVLTQIALMVATEGLTQILSSPAATTSSTLPVPTGVGPSSTSIAVPAGAINSITQTGASSSLAGSQLSPQLLAEEVANGHALSKHLAGGEFASLGIRTKGQFQNFVEDIVSSPATLKRYASDGTTFYLDETTRTVVINGSRGEATAFRPDYGIGWDNYLKTRVPKNAQAPGYDPVPGGR